MFKLYNSVGDLARHATQLGPWQSDSLYSSWTGETFKQAVAYATSGNDRLVPEAEKLMNQLEHQLNTTQVVWERSVVGAFPVVPDFLAGEIACMRTREPHYTDRAPIRVIVDLSSSAGIDAVTLRKRGVAILSLVMALSQTRPIELIGCSTGNGRDGETIVAFRINTQPLDLATACYTLTSCAMDRILNMSIMQKINGYSGGWPRTWVYGGDNTKYLRRVAQLCGGDETSLIVKPVELSDPIVREPVKWINEQLARYNQPEEDLT